MALSCIYLIIYNLPPPTFFFILVWQQYSSVAEYAEPSQCGSPTRCSHLLGSHPGLLQLILQVCLHILGRLQTAGGLGGVDTLRLLSLQPCRFSSEGDKIESKQGSLDISEPGEKLSLAVQPFCEGPDLPKFQLLFGHPGLHSDGSGQLGRLLFLGPQRTGAKAFPLRRRRFCLREANRSKYLFFFNVPRRSAASFRSPPTFLGFPVAEGADDLPDAVFRADAVRPHVPSLDDLRGRDVSVGGF